jgi:NADH-quinone oxidoreductase subunit J
MAEMMLWAAGTKGVEALLLPLAAAPQSPGDVGGVGTSAAVSPILILFLCVIAGVGTMLALPRRRGDTAPKVGGLLLALAGAILAVTLVKWTIGVVGKSGVARPSYIYFWLFAIVALGGSIRVITHPRPVYSALYFVLTVFATAGLFILMWAEFMAAALVLIYAGAILVTYVFVIMLASEASGGPAGGGLPEHDVVSREPFLASLIGFGMMGIILFVVFDKAQPITRNALGGMVGPPNFSPTQQLGAFLFRDHFVNIQLAGLILTLAMVGAIVIARKKIYHTGGPEREAISATSPLDAPAEVVLGPATPASDDPHSIPVAGTTNPRQKAYPET